MSQTTTDTTVEPAEKLGGFMRRVIREVAENAMSEACKVKHGGLLHEKEDHAALFVNDGANVTLTVRVDKNLNIDPAGAAQVELRFWITYA